MSSPYVGPRLFTALVYNYSPENGDCAAPWVVSPDEVQWERTWVRVYCLDTEKKISIPILAERLMAPDAARTLARRLFACDALDPGVFVQTPSLVWAMHAGPLKWLERYARRTSEAAGSPPVMIKSLVDEAYQEPITIQQRQSFSPSEAAKLLLLSNIPSEPTTLDSAFNWVVLQHTFLHV